MTTILFPNDTFTDVGEYDLSDLIKGGDNGAANAPIKALTDRTFYLSNRLLCYETVKQITGSYVYDTATDARCLLSFTINDNKTFTLPDVSTLKIGTIISINLKTTGIKALTVQTQAISQLIYDGTTAVWVMYMHDSERLKLVAAEDHWEIELADGNFKTAGMDFYSRKRNFRNAIIAQGQTVLRQDMPRLAAFALSLPNTVPDYTWTSYSHVLDSAYSRGFYSSGDGSTSIRLPDESGLFTRAMDPGHLIDNDRVTYVPGEFQGMMLQSHTHDLKYFAKGGGDGNNVLGIEAALYTVSMPLVQPTGGAETRPVNIAKYPLILY
jgi:hypothetical protein